MCISLIDQKSKITKEHGKDLKNPIICGLAEVIILWHRQQVSKTMLRGE